jgi:NADH-quinone oxidoreductase subunit K
MQTMIGYENYLWLASALFCIGLVGVLVRRNVIILLMCIELMLNASNLLFVVFSKMWGNLDGHIFVFFSMLVAAAEVAVGLALIVLIYRRFKTIDISFLDNLKG